MSFPFLFFSPGMEVKILISPISIQSIVSLNSPPQLPRCFRSSLHNNFDRYTRLYSCKIFNFSLLRLTFYELLQKFLKRTEVTRSALPSQWGDFFLENQATSSTRKFLTNINIVNLLLKKFDNFLL